MAAAIQNDFTATKPILPPISTIFGNWIWYRDKLTTRQKDLIRMIDHAARFQKRGLLNGDCFEFHCETLNYEWLFLQISAKRHGWTPEFQIELEIKEVTEGHYEDCFSLLFATPAEGEIFEMRFKPFSSLHKDLV